MVVYKLYWRDEQEEDHFIGMLPERRKDPARITKESITNPPWPGVPPSNHENSISYGHATRTRSRYFLCNWAREAWGQNVEREDISFIKIRLDDSEKVISGYLPTND